MKMSKMKVITSMTTMATIAMQLNIALGASVDPKVKNAVSNILGGVQVVGIVVAAAMILYAGFKFLTAGAGEKAKAKDMLVPLAVGAILVALAAPIANWIWGLVTGTDGTLSDTSQTW